MKIFSFKKKGSIIWDMMGWIMLAVVILLVLIGLIMVLKGKGDNIFDRIKDMF